MKKQFYIIVFIFFLFNSYIIADRYIKIGMIDFAYIFNNYSGTIKLRLELDKYKNSFLNKINQKRKILQKMQNDFKNKINLLSDLERKLIFAEIEVFKARLEEEMEVYHEEIKKIEYQKTIDFRTELYLAAKKIAEQRGFSLVIEKNAFVSVDEQYNLTKAVLIYLERKLRGELRE